MKLFNQNSTPFIKRKEMKTYKITTDASYCYAIYTVEAICITYAIFTLEDVHGVKMASITKIELIDRL